MKKAGKWSYELDMSTNIGKDTQLVVFMKYVKKRQISSWNSIMCTTGNYGSWSDIINVVDNFQQEIGRCSFL